MKKRILAMLLALCLMVLMVPFSAMAEGDEAGDEGFSDIAEWGWAQPAIERWNEVDVLQGDANADTFRPGDPMNRAEFSSMLVELMGYEDMPAANPFADVKYVENETETEKSDWCAVPMMKLYQAGVLAGVPTTDGLKAEPAKSISREEAAALLCRALNIDTSDYTSVDFKDKGQVASWAVGPVAAMEANGWMVGVGGNRFAPKMGLNRASGAQMLNGMIAAYMPAEGAEFDGEGAKVTGVILVTGAVADGTVNIKNAELSAPVVVAPGAESAEITLEDVTVAEVVLLADEVTVDVDGDSSVENVVVKADSAIVTGEGTVENVDVTDASGTVKVETEGTEVTGDGDHVDVIALETEFELEANQEINMKDGKVTLKVVKFPSGGTLVNGVFDADGEVGTATAVYDEETDTITIEGLPAVETETTYTLKVTFDGEGIKTADFTFTPKEITDMPEVKDGQWEEKTAGKIELEITLKKSGAAGTIYRMYEWKGTTPVATYEMTTASDKITFNCDFVPAKDDDTLYQITAEADGKVESYKSYTFKLGVTEPEEGGSTCGAGTVTNADGSTGNTGETGNTCGAGTVTTGSGSNSSTGE